jgi:hypothetical protein
MQQFHDGSMTLVDRRIGIRAAPGVGVRDGDSTESCTADDVRPFRLEKLGIE